MKQMMQGVRSLVVALTCAAVGTAGAADFAIQSFDGTGRLVFNTVSNAMSYRLERGGLVQQQLRWN